MTLACITEEAYEGLYRFAISLSKSPSDAADLVQQTYWKWIKQRDQIKDPSKSKSWLFTTLHREFLKEIRRKGRLSHLEDCKTPETLPAVQVDPGGGLDGELAMQALQQVPDPYRAALTLFYVEDFTYGEIATLLGIPPGTVMSRIHRGKGLLRKIFSQYD